MRAGRGHAGRLSRRDVLATVTDTDRRLLTLLAEQRVLTQTQLERLLAGTPARTLRYRTERLTRQGLVGRSRPYRDKGSAPFHYWPTRASDAFVRGEPVPRGGERGEPNPQFLHHAERLSELYVLLQVQAPTVGLHLHQFKREGEARELFRADGRERALAPDALVHLHDDNGRGLLAFVELDMGTMSHARLKTKAASYAAYAAEAKWTESHPFCPCLLFLTTTETRAAAFLKLLSGLLDKHRRYSSSFYGDWGGGGTLSWFATAACAHAREPERALAEACWDDLSLAGGGLTLPDCLNKARAAYDARRANEEAKQRARDEKRQRLRTKPEARRAYLQEKHLRFQGEHLTLFGGVGATALQLLLGATEPMSEIEQEAFAAIVRQLDDDPLEAEPSPEPVPPTCLTPRRSPRWSSSTADASEHASKSLPAATAKDPHCAATGSNSVTADSSATTATTHSRSEHDATTKHVESKSGCGSSISTAASGTHADTSTRPDSRHDSRAAGAPCTRSSTATCSTSANAAARSSIRPNPNGAEPSSTRNRRAVNSAVAPSSLPRITPTNPSWSTAPAHALWVAT
jgi:Replication-relaxation